MHEILIADVGLEDFDVLAAQQRPGIRTILVSASEDAHAVLAAALAEGPSTVHLLAHGEPGRVLLGAHPLDCASLVDRAWPDAPGTEILIHACRVGAGEAGRRFLERLAAATGARVAASSHPVGDAALGGRWTLDVATAAVQASSPFAGAPAWPHLLAYTGTPTNGNDTLVGDDTGNTIDGQDGNDVIVGGTGHDFLMGGAGNDRLEAGGNDGLIVDGQAGDVLEGGAGADTLVGGAGFNNATYEHSTAGITLDLGTPANSTGDAAGDVFIDIQRWIGTGYDDTMIAGNDPVWFWGHAGNDVEYGSAGNDTLEAGDGDDLQYGGAGNDLMYGRADNDTLYGEDGNDSMAGGGGLDLMYGGAGNDLMKGDWGQDTIYGGDGDDTIIAGMDVAGTYTEVQSDLIDGGAGNDRYIVVNQADAGTVSFNGGTGTDTLEISSAALTDWEFNTAPASAAINIAGMTLTSVETLALTGDAAHDVTMTAAQAAGFTSVTGLKAGDVFRIDGLTIAAGDVTAEVVNGDTLLHIGSGAGALTLTLTGTYDTTQFIVANNAVGYGGAPPAGGNPGGNPGGTPGGEPGGTPGGETGGGTGNQTITGTTAGEALTGGAGNDTLIGGGGSDYMTGGAGTDTFVFGTTNGYSTIADFQAGAGGDVIDLRAFTALTGMGDLLTQEDETGTFIYPVDDYSSGIILSGVHLADLTAANFRFAGQTEEPPAPGEIAMTAGTVTHAEGAAGSTTEYAFTVTRSGNTAGASTVQWAVAGSGANPADAADFGGALPGGTVTFADGETTKTITVAVAGDGTVESDEGFTVTLSNATGATLGATVSAQGVITNDDEPPAPTPGEIAMTAGTVTHAEGAAGSTTEYAFTVTRSGNTAGASTVQWAVAGSGANPADAADFGGALPGGTVTFADGETTKTITVAVAGDGTVESDEGFTVTLSNATGATLGTAVSAQGVITNDDAEAPPPQNPPPQDPPPQEPQSPPPQDPPPPPAPAPEPPPPSGTTTVLHGQETLVGNSGNDWAYLDDAGCTVTVQSIVGLVGGIGSDWVNLGDSGNSLSLASVETLIGGAAADWVNLGDGGNTVIMAAVETLIGGASGDWVNLGNRGNTLIMAAVETLIGGSNGDWVNLGNRGNTLIMAAVETLIGGAGQDNVALGNRGNTVILTAIETLTGGAGQDNVTLGNRGNTLQVSGVETLIGGSATDDVTITAGPVRFEGRGGADRLTLNAGGGVDTVVFSSVDDGGTGGATTGFDTIAGFQSGTDRIAVIDALRAAVDHNGDGLLAAVQRAGGTVDLRSDELVELTTQVAFLADDGFASFRAAMGPVATDGTLHHALVLASDGFNSGLYLVSDADGTLGANEVRLIGMASGSRLSAFDVSLG